MKMKFYWTFVLVSILVVTVLAKDSKDHWRQKKEKHQKSLAKKHHFDNVKENNKDYNKGSYDIVTPTEYKGETKAHTLKHYFGKKKLNKKSKKYAAGKKMKKVHKAMAWLNIRSEMDCDYKCKSVEVCISGPVVKKPICIHKKDMKKSLKMFHRFHKKEMKDWRKYQKKYYKNDWKLKEEKYGRNDKKLSKEEFEKYEKMAKEMTKDELAALKKEKREKLGKKNHFHRKFHVSKPIVNINPKTKMPVCGTSELNQMKTRLQGWFHLLHGQDHEARKAHGGSIAKFYKHVSVKKELREFNGQKCQCMKSAMWQFHQMDKDPDDHLVDTELAMMEENTLEPCMRPYLESCDKNGDSKINSDEWCCCFTKALPPCYKQLDAIRKSGEPVIYMPRCDKEGYYMHEQCKGGDSKNPLTCWCVDYNGNEFQDTAKQGRAHCHKVMKYAYKQEIPLA